MSVRLKLTLSYAGFLLVTGFGLIAVVWVFLLRYVPAQAISLQRREFADGSLAPGAATLFIPGRADLWAAFAPKAALLLGVLLVLGLAGGWILAGRMLAPLTRIANAARKTTSSSFSHRIELDGRQDEFRELADTFDDMLARLEAHQGEQQRFAANASHELRTPLAITQSLLDVVRSDPNREPDELLDRLYAVNARAIELTEALLLLSRADQRSFAHVPVDLSLLAEDAAETLLPLAEQHGVLVETAGDGAFASGSRALLLQLTTNLLHNAIVHNLPEGGSAVIITSVTPDAAVLTVENTGERLGADTVATLTEPFQRGSERVRHDHAGVGLGLAIVKSIAQAHDGSLTLDPRAGGGLSVTVRLPLAR